MVKKIQKPINKTNYFLRILINNIKLNFLLNIQLYLISVNNQQTLLQLQLIQLLFKLNPQNSIQVNTF